MFTVAWSFSRLQPMLLSNATRTVIITYLKIYFKCELVKVRNFCNAFSYFIIDCDRKEFRVR
ncbi:hypothetical protein PUN28_001615 [Cardiocondyla obscurior]|uniref:Uncharacterized protein n=1 Tax=Cardiocondyla obscurior TaxID=286306 RepID=A0AAW2GQB1_9HYME